MRATPPRGTDEPRPRSNHGRGHRGSSARTRVPRPFARRLPRGPPLRWARSLGFGPYRRQPPRAQPSRSARVKAPPRSRSWHARRSCRSGGRHPAHGGRHSASGVWLGKHAEAGYRRSARGSRSHAGMSVPVSAGGYAYERRRPELGTLHRVVRENLHTLYAATEQGFSTPLPQFVRRELEHYLDCGLLCRGFAVLACDGCAERRLIPRPLPTTCVAARHSSRQNGWTSQPAGTRIMLAAKRDGAEPHAGGWSSAEGTIRRS